jgi:TetR/AcrR family transcriptional repressor of nem operon
VVGHRDHKPQAVNTLGWVATDPDTRERPVRMTARGAATRQRIVEAAAELMWVNGVSATTLDAVRAGSETSKGQFYRYFHTKEELVQAVIELQATRVLTRESERLAQLDSLRGLERWRDAIVQGNTLRNGAFGCVLGSLANELADTDEDARRALAGHLQAWQALLAAGFERMRDKGVLRPDADPQALAVGMMAALQGGYLLAQTVRDSAPMSVALDMAIEHVRAFT